jgi:hypothetical protein
MESEPLDLSQYQQVTLGNDYSADMTDLPLDLASPDAYPPGHVVVGHMVGTVSRVEPVTDVDGKPLGVESAPQPEAVYVFSVPPDSPRLARLAEEKAQGVTYGPNGEVILP